MLRWSPILSILFGLAAGPLAAQAPGIELRVTEGTLELDATWLPLIDTVYKIEQRETWLRELAPAAARATYGAEHFRALLPQRAVAVGDVWSINVDALLPFLRQLHPGATGDLHHGGGQGVSAPGAYACLRAFDAGHAEITIRAHVDFMLRGDGQAGETAWFTPAQFAGALTIDTTRGVVQAFSLAVPDQRANVDVNLPLQGHVVADIGRVPKMEVRGGRGHEFGASAQLIPVADAAQRLLRAFYPVAQVEWLDLPVALRTSRETGKPLHVVVLFGSLLDESC